MHPTDVKSEGRHFQADRDNGMSTVSKTEELKRRCGVCQWRGSVPPFWRPASPGRRGGAGEVELVQSAIYRLQEVYMSHRGLRRGGATQLLDGSPSVKEAREGSQRWNSSFTLVLEMCVPIAAITVSNDWNVCVHMCAQNAAPPLRSDEQDGAHGRCC